MKAFIALILMTSPAFADVDEILDRQARAIAAQQNGMKKMAKCADFDCRHAALLEMMAITTKIMRGEMKP